GGLGIILSFHGRIVPLTELRQACGVSRDGSKASNMVRAAQSYGLEAKGLKKNLEGIRSMTAPFIVFWDFNHFLVVDGWNRQRVFLNDPATGPRTVSWAEFDQGFTGVVLEMTPGDSFMRGGRKPSLLLALVRQIRRSLGAWLYVVFLGFLLVIPGLVTPVFSQIFVDQILMGDQQDWLRSLILGLLLTALLQLLLRGLQYGRLRDLKIKLMVAMNGQFLWHILRLPLGFYAQRFAGEISARMTLNNQVSDVIAGQLSATVIDLMMLVFYGVVMFSYDPLLTGVGIAVAVINLMVLQWVSRQRVDTNLRLNQDLGKLAGVEISGLQRIETLKATAAESDFFGRWSGYFAKYINAQQELSLASLRISLLPPLLSSVTTMLILVLGGLRVMDGHLTIGMLVAFQSLMASFQGPVQALVGFGQQLQTLESDLYRLDDVLNHPVDEGLNPEAESLELLPPLQGRLEFRQVSFGYSPVAPPLIEDLSFVLEPGKRIALVGGSGSGKSTIAKLAAGLYQPWQGEILLDDCPRQDYNPLTLAQSVAMVEQDIFLFGGTVLDNLSLWDSSVSLSVAMDACQDAEIHEVIAAMPGGYSGTLLEEGADLSGGQRQRLEIARALVNSPSLLILDEATSALDTETEVNIDQNLKRRGCGCLIVAHRLSTIRDCDEILVLQHGKVVERGTHDQLWAKGGTYAQLLQAEGETLAQADPLPAPSMVAASPWQRAKLHHLSRGESLALHQENRLWRSHQGTVSLVAHFCPATPAPEFWGHALARFPVFSLPPALTGS
ncbi:MAG: NHLP family bacteriocin export ABC transporter peptidase/permease/ATPase subunit, partial [Acaryochloridaceae cyanobacterium RL_2_7]|nr:NHLP family bacteriocin export ABC transporter peptidase/permease/ATPase subunit [Acaryochloridaceae cyanobacterium RL_2_7]